MISYTKSTVYMWVSWIDSATRLIQYSTVLHSVHMFDLVYVNTCLNAVKVMENVANE